MREFLFRLLALLMLLGSLAGCGATRQSPEEAVRALVENAAETAEQRDAGGLLEMIDENYLDRRGQNKQQVAGLLRGYFFTHRNIHLFTRIGDITWLGEEQAKVTLYVAMAGSVIASIEALESLRARVYRFEFDLVRHEGDRWLLQQADWQAANPFDLQ